MKKHTTQHTEAQGKGPEAGPTEGGVQPSQVAERGTAAKGAFDLSRLRIAQDFVDTVGVRKELVTVPVRKPDKQWFSRVHPDERYRLPVAVLELKDERMTYLVLPELAPSLVTEVTPMLLFTAMNRQQLLFLWPVRLPKGGRQDNWSRSAMTAAEQAMTQWVRVVPNLQLGAYDIYTAQATLDEPEWPDAEFARLVEIAFQEQLITSPDHPVLQQLRGER
jgi:hypothetical protein